MPDAPYGDLQAALVGYVELTSDWGEGRVWRAFATRYPSGTYVAQQLFAERELDGFRARGASVETAIEHVLTALSMQSTGE